MGVGEFTDTLNQLPFALNAPFNASYRPYGYDCLPGTRVETLEEIHKWLRSEDERCIFWLKGWAGSGKSAIARTIARYYHTQRQLAASFFFARNGGDSSHAGMFVTTIARQFADCRALDIRQHIRDAFGGQSQIANQTLQDQWAQLVLQPLSKCKMMDQSGVFLLVVDAMGECDEHESIGTLLRIMPHVGRLSNIRFRILVTSRPEMPIRCSFNRMQATTYQILTLHRDVPLETSDRDILSFLRYNSKTTATDYHLSTGWPRETSLMAMVQSAQGLFIWASTAFKFIHEGGRFAERRLSLLMESSDTGAITAPARQLDDLYTAIITGSVLETYDEHESEEAYSYLRRVLGGIAVLLSPVSARTLSDLLVISEDGVLQTVADLHSIIDGVECPGHPLRLHHDSFRSYLLEAGRCKISHLQVNAKQAHAQLLSGCLRIMNAVLGEDICNQKAPGVRVTDVDVSHINHCLSAGVQYACSDWIAHARESGHPLLDSGEILQFLRRHVLHWAEAMSWMGKVSKAIREITFLELASRDRMCLGIHTLVHDTRRFLMYARPAIEHAPLQTYVSAALFTPSRSVMGQLFGNSALISQVRLSFRVPECWSATLLTLEGHSSSVKALKFSPYGTILASASKDTKIILWDVNTGAPLQTLEGHSDTVKDIAFSQDDTTLASASDDTTLRLWDVKTGASLRALEGHSDSVIAVQFSPDSSKM